MDLSKEKKLKIAVGVSGGGRSLQNLLREEPKHAYEVVLVFSSSGEVAANDVALAAGLPLVIEDFSLKNHEIAKKRLYNAAREHHVDLIVLAGFLKLLPIDHTWPGKIINIHPALLPKFGGKGMHGHHVHKAVLESHEEISGATVHFVNERYDEGSIISQTTVPVMRGDTASDLAARVFAGECRLLPWTIDGLACGDLPAKGVVKMPHTVGS